MSVLRRIDQYLSTKGDGTGATAQAVAGTTISGATTADPVVCTAASHGRSVGEYVFIDGATGITEINGLMQINTVPNANTFTLKDLDGNVIGSTGTFGGTVDMQPVFCIKPASGEVYDLVRLNVIAGDASAWVVGGFIGVAALSNGIILAVYRGSTLRKAITTIKKWSDWAMIAGVDMGAIGDVANNKFEMAVRATFAKTEEPIRLEGDEGDMFVMYTQDDLDGLSFLQAAVQGADDTLT